MVVVIFVYLTSRQICIYKYCNENINRKLHLLLHIYILFAMTSFSTVLRTDDVVLWSSGYEANTYRKVLNDIDYVFLLNKCHLHDLRLTHRTKVLPTGHRDPIKFVIKGDC